MSQQATPRNDENSWDKMPSCPTFSEEGNNEPNQSSSDNLLFKLGGPGVFSQREGRRLEQENHLDIQPAGRGSGCCFAGWRLCVQAGGFGVQPSHRSDFQRGSNTYLCDCPRDTELSFAGDQIGRAHVSSHLGISYAVFCLKK